MTEKELVAVVSGASSGMGREIAIRLAGHGYKVIAAARRMDRLTELAVAHPGIVPRQVDLSAVEEVQDLCRYLEDLPQTISLLVNNAGYAVRGALEDVPVEDIRRLFEVNLFSQIRLTQACLPGMRRQRQGIIVNISSMVGKFAFPMNGVYAASKHAFEAINQALRLEVRPFGIRIVTIRPGFIATEFNDAANALTGDLMARTHDDYKPLYRDLWTGVGKLLGDATIPGPELIADLVLDAVLSDSPKTFYSAGFLAEEMLDRRAALDDETFEAYLAEKTGLRA